MDNLMVNLYTKQNFTINDIVLTKGENVRFKLDTADGDALDYTEIKSVGKNLVINVYSSPDIHNDTTYRGQAVLKNYAAKDVVTNKGSLRIFNSNNVLLYDIRSEFRETTIIDENYKSKSFKSHWFNEDIDASDYVMYSGGTKVTDASKKGLTITLGSNTTPPAEEYNNTVIGSKYSDTIKGGTGDDKIEGGTGNDIITGGKGVNRIVYNKNDGDDVITLTKGECLTLELTDLSSEDLDFDFKNGNLVISYTNSAYRTSTITLKGFGSKDVTNNSTKTTPDTSYVHLITTDVTELTPIDLREKLYHVDVVKSYTGNWHNEDIDASGYVNTKNTKGLTLNGGLGDDTISGSKYDDTMTGGKGSDTFKFNILADTTTGIDTIKDATSEDKLEFTGTTFEKLKFYRNGNNLEIKNTVNNDDKIIVQNYYKTPQNLNKIVIGENTYKISDIPLSDIYLTGSGKINGIWGYTNILGSDKNDTIKALDTDDTIEAGKGNDTIWGGGGANTFVFSYGDGVDTIKDSKNADILKLNDIVLDFESATFGRSGNNLVLMLNSLDRIIFENYYTASSCIDTIIDTDGTEFSIKDYIADIPITGKGTIKGTSGDDIIIGSSSADKIYGYDGNDALQGCEGNDTLYGGKGYNQYWFWKTDGKDTVIGNMSQADGIDVLYFVDSTFNELRNYKMVGNDLVISYNSGKDSVTVKNYLKAANNVLYIADSTYNPEDPSTIKSLREVYPNIISSTKPVVNGSEISDEIRTGNLDTVVSGNGGSDNIYTGDKNDTVYTYKKGKKNPDPTSTVYVDTIAGDNSLYAQSATTTLHGSTGNDTYYSYMKDQKTAVVEDVFKDTPKIGTNTVTIMDANHNDINVIFNITSAKKIEKLFNDNTLETNFFGGVGFVDNENLAKWKNNPNDTENIHGTFINFNIEELNWEDPATFSKVVSSVTNVYAKDGYYIPTTEITSIVTQVLAWLSTESIQYSNTTDVLLNGSAADVQSLVAIYQTATWTKPEAVG